MPVENATFISQLIPANPAVNDPISQGAQQLSLLKTVLQATFPNATAAINATPAQLNALAKLLGTTPGASIVLNDGTATDPSTSLTATSTGATLAVTPAPTSSVPNPAAVTAITVDGSGNATVAGNLSAASVQQAGNPLLPEGVIVMWSGAVTAIPAGWYLCDGTNGTPNLTGQFIMGASGLVGSPVVGQTGGSATVTANTASAGSHNHTGATASAGAASLAATCDTQGSHSHGGYAGDTALTIAQMPAHTHGFHALLPGAPAGLQYGSNTGYSGDSTTGSTGSGQTHNHTISTDGAHAHNIGVSPVPAHTHGISQDGAHVHSISLNTLPPYYALAFIQKS